MGSFKSTSRSILKWMAISAIAMVLVLIGYLIFFLPEGIDHTFNLSSRKTLTFYQSSNIEFGYEHFEGGNRQGYRIKAGHLRIRFEEPSLWL